MEKEIHEQPEVISHTLAHYLDFASGVVEAARPAVRFRQARPAGDLGLRHGLSRRPHQQILVRALCAAAGRHRCRLRIPLPRDAAVEGERRAVHVAVGRDRRYAGLAALLPQGGGMQIGAIVNVRESTMARESDVTLPTLAGPEIGVASTKAFTCQLAVLASLAVRAGAARGTVTRERGKGAGARSFRRRRASPARCSSSSEQIEKVARELAQVQARALSRPRHQLSRWPWKAR